ncbi:MAG: autotransporter domain-containing protein, partial [Gammaproteobacteria bacterium]|nr:autotransporter domain-containing protein [Gammaproteobacteria bacterium]
KQAVSTGFGVLLPQVSFKWVQEFEDNSDPINAYFVADPNQTRLSFETGNKDQGYMNMQLGVTAVLPRGLAAFIQYETQQFVDDYQQSMISLGARKEF